MSRRTLLDLTRDGEDLFFSWKEHDMESNGERIAEMFLHPRGQIIKTWKATTPGAEPREEIEEARFEAPDGDMWFLIDLDIYYDHNRSDRTILGIKEHWKILRHDDFYWPGENTDDSDEGMNEETKRNQESKGNKMGQGRTKPSGWSSKGEGKGGIRCHCICSSVKGATCMRHRLHDAGSESCKGEGKGGLRHECIREAKKPQAKLEAWARELQEKGGLRQECYTEAAEAWARLQALAMREGWYGNESFKRARKE